MVCRRSSVDRQGFRTITQRMNRLSIVWSIRDMNWTNPNAAHYPPSNVGVFGRVALCHRADAWRAVHASWVIELGYARLP